MTQPAPTPPVTLATSGCYRILWSSRTPTLVLLVHTDTGRLVRTLVAAKPELLRSVAGAAAAAAVALDRSCVECNPPTGTPAPTPSPSDYAAAAAEVAGPTAS